MRRTPNLLVEHYRLMRGVMASTTDMGNNGMFIVPYEKELLRVLVSDGWGWDHASVSLKHRRPTWEEMCHVKGLFFRDTEAVMLLVPRSAHINNNPHCLHLWRPQTAEDIASARQVWGSDWVFGDLLPPGTIPLPPAHLVGIPGVSPEQFERMTHAQKEEWVQKMFKENTR